MNIQEAYYFEEKEAREKAEEQKMKGKRKVYEWMYKVVNEQHWHILSRLMTLEEVEIWLKESELQPIKYKKTGREFIVDNDTPQLDER